jgi:HTH-type transcriptional regulator / antitoxin HipB
MQGTPKKAHNALYMMQIGLLMDLVTIGALFRQARRESRITQGELARTLGMSRATLSALESGRCHEIGVRKLTALLEAVGLDLLVAPRRGRA